MNEIPTNSAPARPVIAKKPARAMRKRPSRARNVHHAKHLVRHMLRGVEEPAQPIDEKAKSP
jgi:hypothetical protein